MSSLFGIGGGGNVGAAGGFYSYSIDQSLRFNDGDSAYLSRTPASAGNQKTWTWSAWVKRSSIDNTNAYMLFDASTADTNASLIEFGKSTEGDTALNVVDYQGGERIRLRTNMKFRDVSSFYHIVVAVDTTQATSTDRVKIYVNGEHQTSLAQTTYPSQNDDTLVNATNEHRIGKWHSSTRYFDGYMAEVNFIDGTALDPTSFGETINGVWVPKRYSGSYGTNGFYVDFSSGSFTDNASDPDVFADQAGSNDFNAYNFEASDVMTGESPTNNFSTINILDSHAASTYTEGNLNFADAGGDGATCLSTFVVPDIADTTTYYIELLHHQGYALGIAPENFSAAHNITTRTGILSWYSNGNLYTAGAVSTSSWSTASTTGEIRSMVVGNGQVEYFRNGVSLGVAFTGLTGAYKIAEWAVGSAGTGVTFNFGQDDTFANAVTSGSAESADANGHGKFYYSEAASHISLCAANLPEPTIGPNSTEQADDYFNTVLYTGDGTSSNAITVGLQPDWTWIKTRNGTASHALFDSVRGADNVLRSNGTDEENASGISTASFGGLTSFDSDGFTVDDGSDGTFDATNGSGDTYVSWNWKAGGAPSVDNSAANNAEPTAGSAKIDGSNQSGAFSGSPSIAIKRLSASTAAGISIVKWTGTGSAGTIPHGLGAAPDFYVVKNLTDSGTSWQAYHVGIASDAETDYIYLNSTAAAGDSDDWNDTAPTANVFSVKTHNQVNASGDEYIAYLFTSIEGFSKHSSFVGNGSTDGTFVYTGFRPAWVMVKRSSASGGWHIFDNKRPNAFNVIDKRLEADNGDAENSTSGCEIDFVSNGMKFKGNFDNINGSGNTHIYLAIGDQPQKYSNAR